MTQAEFLGRFVGILDEVEIPYMLVGTKPRDSCTSTVLIAPGPVGAVTAIQPRNSTSNSL